MDTLLHNQRDDSAKFGKAAFVVGGAQSCMT